MKRLWLIGVAVISGISFLLSGCGESDKGIEERMLAQQYIDKGQYDAALALLLSKGSFDDSDKMLLAAAYMGKSGFSFNQVLKIIAVTNDSTNRANNKAFVAFLQNVQQNVQSDTQVTSIDNAYTELDTLLYDSTQAKLDRGIVLAMRASVTLGLLGKLKGFDKTDQFAVDDLTATACAMDYITDGNLSSSKCSSVNVAGSTTSINGQNYKVVTIDVNGSSFNHFYKLANAGGNDLVMTKGACAYGNHTDSNCIDIGSGSGPWVPTPILDGNQTMTSTLVTALNNGIDTIIASAPADVRGDVQQYKNEIDADSDGNITAQELANYIQSKL